LKYIQNLQPSDDESDSDDYDCAKITEICVCFSIDRGIFDWCDITDAIHKVWPNVRSLHILGQNYHYNSSSILKCDLDQIYIEKDIQSSWPFGDECITYVDGPLLNNSGESFTATIPKSLGHPKTIIVDESWGSSFRKRI